MPLTSADVVNAALELTGEQVTVSGADPAYDGSTVGAAAGILYRPAVEMLLRQINPDFARKIAILGVQANTSVRVVTNWAFEYAYPIDCLRLRRLRPPAGDDAFSPLPVRGMVVFDPLTAGGPARVVLTNMQNVVAIYTTSAAGVGAEHLWDSAFLEAVTRRLANPLAMAVAGRPDFAREMLEESAKFAQMAELVREL
jgi:hypothetical protein